MPRALQRQRGWKLEHRLVLDAAAEQQQSGLTDVALRDVHARSHRGRSDGDVAGHVHERSGDDELRETERERVANVRIERDEEGGVHEGASTGLQTAPFPRGRRHDLAVERIAGRDGSNL